MTKVFIFDQGGVVGRRVGKYVIADVSKSLGLKRADVSKAYRYVSGPENAGWIDDKNVWQALAGRLGVKDVERLRKVTEGAHARYTKQKGVNKRTVAIIGRLRSRGYRIVALTNAVPFLEAARRKAGHYKYFDEVFVSWRLRMAKPDPRIFKYCMKKMGVKPGECVFIDNGAENVSAARKLGIKSILFRNATQLRRNLRGYL